MLGVPRFNSWWELGIFLFTTMSRIALGTTQPLIQWVPGILSLGVSGWGVKLTTHLHLQLRSRMHGTLPPLLHYQYIFTAWCLVRHRDNFTSFNNRTYTLPWIYSNRTILFKKKKEKKKGIKEFIPRVLPMVEITTQMTSETP
jgi:hypothetical protein